MTQDVEQVFAKLPSGFFGEVTIGFKNGQPYFAKVTATTNFEKKTSPEKWVGNNGQKQPQF
jgi:hypothetical protein